MTRNEPLSEAEVEIDEIGFPKFEGSSRQVWI